MNTLVTAEEAAKILGMTRQQLYYHTRKGRIPFVDLGRRRMYNRDALAKLGMGEESPSQVHEVERCRKAKPHDSLF